MSEDRNLMYELGTWTSHVGSIKVSIRGRHIALRCYQCKVDVFDYGTRDVPMDEIFSIVHAHTVLGAGVPGE